MSTLSIYRQSRVLTVLTPEVIYVRPTVKTVFIDKVILLLVGSHAAFPPFGRPTVLSSSDALLTVSLVLGLSSRLTCSQDICSRSTVRTSDTLGSSFALYKFVTYLQHHKHCPGIIIIIIITYYLLIKLFNDKGARLIPLGIACMLYGGNSAWQPFWGSRVPTVVV